GALTYAGTFGRLTGVTVDDMEAQVYARGHEGADTRLAPVTVGVVAASRGAGNRELFESMGAVVIEGGQGANPSAADFAEAVEKTGAPAVILLPNNKNIVPTAEQASELVEAKTYVVPTTTIVSGLAAMVGYDGEGEAEEVAEEMCEILGTLHSAEVTRAVRDVRIGDYDVSEGSYIGLLDGELHAVGESVEEVARKLAKDMLGSGADMITLLAGADLNEETLQSITAGIAGLDEDLTVEAKTGGQPMYPLQMVAE
ncbi:MAG TPA: hypothetical protein VHM16_07605, partial [Rubrobacteraceae bacterium]|nr:hypothetical protein [Rubrobacteraceae bacterium]